MSVSFVRFEHAPTHRILFVSLVKRIGLSLTTMLSSAALNAMIEKAVATRVRQQLRSLQLPLTTRVRQQMRKYVNVMPAPPLEQSDEFLSQDEIVTAISPDTIVTAITPQTQDTIVTAITPQTQDAITPQTQNTITPQTQNTITPQTQDTITPQTPQTPLTPHTPQAEGPSLNRSLSIVSNSSSSTTPSVAEEVVDTQLFASSYNDIVNIYRGSKRKLYVHTYTHFLG